MPIDRRHLPERRGAAIPHRCRWTTDEHLALLRQGAFEEFFVDGRMPARAAARAVAMARDQGHAYLVDAVGARRARPSSGSGATARGSSADALAAFPADVRDRVLAVAGSIASPWRRRTTRRMLRASLSEGSGRAVMQAMAAALPIVATPVGVVPDLLRDGRDCLIVPKRDHHALVAAVLRLLDDVGLRREMGTSVRRVSEAFRSEAADANHGDLVEAVARTGRLPA